MSQVFVDDITGLAIAEGSYYEITTQFYELNATDEPETRNVAHIQDKANLMAFLDERFSSRNGSGPIAIVIKHWWVSKPSVLTEHKY